jgi:quercetin dioxygenase-like cupin family protein
MRSSAKQLVLAVFVGSLIAAWSAHHVAAQRHTPITVTRLYSGPDGQTHAGNIEVTLMPSRAYPGTEESESFKVSGAQFLRLPPGNVQDWHNAARRQYVVTLSGRGKVELMGGEKIQLTPGRIVLAEDVTGKGHITRSIGPEDLVFLIVPFATK